jgi:hypothetical protein
MEHLDFNSVVKWPAPVPPVLRGWCEPTETTYRDYLQLGDPRGLGVGTLLLLLLLLLVAGGCWWQVDASGSQRANAG